MEIYRTTFNGHAVSVIFNGGFYLFFNEAYGFLASATRSKLAHEEHHEFFTLTYGNHYCGGGTLCNSRIESNAKRFIRKIESAHGAAVVDFETHEADLANAWIDLESAFKILS